MKYLKQFLIILLISLIGEVLNYLLPWPVPASIYGMIILFICLTTGIVKLHQVKEVGAFLLDIMPIMFVPAGVGLMSAWGLLSPVIVPVIVITIVGLVLVIALSGLVAQTVIRHANAKEVSHHE